MSARTPEGEHTDERGVRWTETSFTLPNGEGDTFGPHHPAVPVVVRALRETTAKGGAPEDREPDVVADSRSSIT